MTTAIAFALVAILSLGTLPAGDPVGTPAAITTSKTISSGDGLTLGLSSNGAVSKVVSASRTLPRLASTAPGGFSLRLVGGTPNLLANPGFAKTSSGLCSAASWSFTGTSYRPTLVKSPVHGGSCSVRIVRGSIGTTGTFRQTVTVRPKTNYVAGAWIRTSSILPSATGGGNLASSSTADSPLKIRVEQLSGSGSILDRHWILGYTDTSAWSRHSVGFRTRSSTAKVRLTAYLDKGSGTAWFDDLWLRQLFQDADLPVRGSVTKPTTTTLRQTADLTSLKLRFRADYTKMANHIVVKGYVQNYAADSPGTDKAFRLTFALPVNAVGWQFGDYPRSSRKIASGVTYGYETGGLIETSRYPFGEIHDIRSLVALGTPLDSPSLSRFRYDDRRGLTLSFDLGASRAAMSGKAPFSFVIYRASPTWGFRAATDKFYDIQPAAFGGQVDPARAGAWYLGAVANKDALDDPLTPDNEARTVWGLGLHVGSDDPAWDKAHGIYSAPYTHHWGYFYDHPDCSVTSCTDMPSYEQLKSRLTSEKTSGDARTRDYATATLNSTLRDQNGRMRYDKNVFGIRWYESVEPAISSGTDWNLVVDRYQVDAVVSSGNFDAMYIDSSSGMRTWGGAIDYSRVHWAKLTNRPLSFSYDTGSVGLINFVNMYGQFARMAERLHAAGMITAVDFNADEAVPMGYFGADRIDFLAFENGIREHADGAKGISADSFALQKRVMAYQKPVSVLDPKIGDICGAAGSAEMLDAERRLQQLLFYGIFPGPNKEEPHPWWDCAALRATYGKYTPLFQAVTTAGWEPITDAVSSSSSVWVERYGTLSPGTTLYLTLRNETTSSRTATVSQIRARGGTLSGITATELVSGASLAGVGVSGGRGTFSITIPAGTTRLVRITGTFS